MDEMLNIVDDNDDIVSKASRSEVKEKGLIHRVVKIIVINPKGEFLVQKRSRHKDTFPGFWDIGVAETVPSGESYEETAVRGLKEEVGINNISVREMARALQFRFKYRSGNFNVNYKIYKLDSDGKIRLQTDEIDEAKFTTAEGVKKLIKSRKFHPAAALVFEKYLEMNNIK